MMQLELYRSLWASPGRSAAQIAEEAAAEGFTGLEGGLPENAAERAELARALDAHGLSYIGEICTGGAGPAWWVPPRHARVADHLATFEAGLAAFDDFPVQPGFVNCMGGLDAWPPHEALTFFEGAMSIARRYERTVVFETHRTRCLYAPWASVPILQALPELLITCDFSHWVVVAERLIDDEVDALALAARHAHHVQCRVGYPQGPQVPHPAAPEYADCLAAHQRWWEAVWTAQQERGYARTTLTPEFGPDGYLHTLPFTDQPVADLWDIARWMARTERAHFEAWARA